MKFNQKIDFLLKITGIANNTLAKAVSLDSSYISRLRKGTRVPSRKQNYIKNMALFFFKEH
ncbi:MAG: hypothetical protein GX275_04720 [Clostridiales bacterium]|nr:hypothetical protein [Clostridiales bacterium]